MKDIEKRWTLALLQIIRVDGNIYFLLNEENTFLKFSKIMRLLKKEGYILVEGNQTFLTGKGDRYYASLCKEIGVRGIYKYLMSDLRNQFRPMGLNDIYIPKKKRKKGEKNGDIFSS